jgi:hypothetical protein
MATTNATITSNFPYPVLTALGTTNTDPTFETLQVLQVQLNVNAASIHSDRGDGVNDHLALMTTPTYYAIIGINHAAFRPPTNPPAVPAHADEAKSAQIAEDNRDHAHQWHEFNHYYNVDKHLHNQLITAVPAIYIVALHDPVVAFLKNNNSRAVCTPPWHVWWHHRGRAGPEHRHHEGSMATTDSH